MYCIAMEASEGLYVFLDSLILVGVHALHMYCIAMEASEGSVKDITDT